MPRPVRTVFSVGLTAFLSLSVMTSCSSARSSDAAGIDTANVEKQPLSYFQEKLDAAYQDTSTDPPATAPKPQPGKNIVVVPYGLAGPSGEIFAKGAQEAGAALHWNIRIADGEFDTNQQSDAIRQAVAAKADGIVVYVIDCAAIQSAAREAKNAGVPIIYASGFDCNVDDKNGPVTGYDNGTFNLLSREKTGDYLAFYKAMGQLEAIAAIVETGGKMKAVSLNETDSRVTLAITEGFTAEAAKCADCEIVTQIDLVASDFGPALQAKVQQTLLQHPDANVIFGNYDDVIVGGVAAAVRSAGKIGQVYVTGSPGYPSNVDLMRGNGGQDMASGFSVTWEAWAALDRLNRLFHNDQESPRNGIGFAAIDHERNLPQANAQWEPAIDFRSLYKKAWGV